jgi:hypothetical protein
MAGGDGDFAGMARGCEAVKKRSDHRVELWPCTGCARCGRDPLRSSVGRGSAALASHYGEASERGDATTVQAAEFRQISDEPQEVTRPTPWTERSSSRHIWGSS